MQALNNLSDEQVESSAVFQPKQRTEKREAVTTANQSKTGPNPNLCPIRRQNRPLFEVPFNFPLRVVLVGADPYSRADYEQSMNRIKSRFPQAHDLSMVRS